MKVLVACEFSGVVRSAFAARGHAAVSCDLFPCEIPDAAGSYHYQGDIMDILNDDLSTWDLMIAHPPCTYLTNSGVCWLAKDKSRWARLDEAAEFFNLLWNAPIPRIAVENPIMHKYARERIGARRSQIIQPWMFGHREKKATCLYLKGLPMLCPTTDLKNETDALPKREQQRLHYLPPGPTRWKERSRTYPGIANAMADQWGQWIAAPPARPESEALKGHNSGVTGPTAAPAGGYGGRSGSGAGSVSSCLKDLPDEPAERKG